MRQPKLRELKEAIKAIFKGPYTIKFPYKPAKVFPNFRGKIIFNPEKCVGCGACSEVCPSKAREIIDDKEKRIRKVIHYQERCIYCGQCVRYCITQEGIKHTPEFDLSSIKKDGYKNEIEKEIILCALCGEVIAPKDQIIWIAKKIGPLMSANPTLFLTYYKELGLVYEPETQIKEFPYRTEYLQVLCPSCRRKVYLEEVWGY